MFVVIASGAHDPNMMSSESRLLTYFEQSPVATEMTLHHTLDYTPREEPITIRIENEMRGSVLQKLSQQTHHNPHEYSPYSSSSSSDSIIEERNLSHPQPSSKDSSLHFSMTDFEIRIEDSNDILTELQRGSIVAKESQMEIPLDEVIPKVNLMDRFEGT